MKWGKPAGDSMGLHRTKELLSSQQQTGTGKHLFQICCLETDGGVAARAQTSAQRR